MSHIYTSADQLIGHTPLLELTHLEKEYDLKARVLAKLEYLNPAGSVKDRIAKAMIDDAEQRGLLKKGSVSSSRPPATPASAWPPSPPRAATASSSSCPRPCPSSAASS
jgi:threonine dehydratase